MASKMWDHDLVHALLKELFVAHAVRGSLVNFSVCGLA